MTNKPITVKVDGRTAMADRQAAVDRFQSDPDCKVFIGTIQAAGVGLTLTASSNVVFAELDWVPGNVSQAEDRCHRIGQQESVLVQHLVLDGSIDAKMVEKIISKQAVITAALDTLPAAKPVALPPVGIVDKPQAAKPALTDSKGRPLPVLTPEQITAVHQCLRMLASVCDGARAEDGCGFNGRDTVFGKSLAAADRLSQKQAGYGQRMVRTYQGQLPRELVIAAGITPKEE